MWHDKTIARDSRGQGMDILIASTIAMVAAHPILADAVAFAGAVVEAVAVVGLIVPGTPIVMAVAGTAALAGSSMLPIVLAAIAGAVLGDGISFWLGWRHGARIGRLWPLSRRPDLLPLAERFFARYGALAVALARFVPVLRNTVPVVAGMARMPMRRFLVANVASAAVWAPTHVYAAQLGGVALRSLQAGNWHASAFAGGGAALLLLGAVLLHRRLGRVAPVTLGTP